MNDTSSSALANREYYKARLSKHQVEHCDRWAATQLVTWERQIREAVPTYERFRSVDEDSLHAAFGEVFDRICRAIPGEFQGNARDYIECIPDRVIEEVSYETDARLSRAPACPHGAPTLPSTPAVALERAQQRLSLPTAMQPTGIPLETCAPQSDIERQVLKAIELTSLPKPTSISVTDMPLLFRVDLGLGFGDEEARYTRGVRALQRAIAKITKVIDASSDRVPKITSNEDGDISLIFVKRSSQWNYPPMSEAVSDEDIARNNGKLTIFLGTDEAGNTVTIDRREFSCLVRWSGITNSGKGEAGLADLFWLHKTQTRDTVRIYIHDPKKVDFWPLRGLDLVETVGTTPHDFVKIMSDVHKELEKRKQMFVKCNAKKLEDYNALHPEAPLPAWIVKTDEFISTLMDLKANPELIGAERRDWVETKVRGTGEYETEEPDYSKCWQRLENLMFDIASQARFAGLHWDGIAQQHKADVLNTRIRGQASIAISFQVDNESDSRMALGGNVSGWEGAHQLTGKGDYLARCNGITFRGYIPRLDPEYKQWLLDYSEMRCQQKSAPKRSAAQPAQQPSPASAVGIGTDLSGSARTFLAQYAQKNSVSVVNLHMAAVEASKKTHDRSLIASQVLGSNCADAIAVIDWLLLDEQEVA